MTEIYSLSPFQEFELWLNGLRTYHENPGAPLESSGAGFRKDFVEEVDTSLKIAGDLVRLADLVLRKDTITETPAGRPTNSTRTLEAQPCGLEDFAELMEFRDFLEPFNIIGSRLSGRVSQIEFQAFGCLLTAQIQRLQKSRLYARMRRHEDEPQLNELLQQSIIPETPTIPDQMEDVLVEFLRNLRVIRYIQDEMRRNFEFRKLLVLFGHCYQCYYSFIRMLKPRREQLHLYRPDIVEGIYSTTFALKLETGKVFTDGLSDIDSQTESKRAYAEMEDALGSIENAFRETFSNLVKLLNPSFDDERLHEDLKRSYEETVLLVEDLTLLRDFIKVVCEEHREDENGWEQVPKTLKGFQETSMRYLFFKDWLAFEKFHRELLQSEDSGRRQVLHRFEVYLSTLLSEVKKRSVLSRFETPIPRAAAN